MCAFTSSLDSKLKELETDAQVVAVKSMEEKRIQKRWSDSRCALGGGCTVAIAEAGYTLALLANARALTRDARLGVLIDQLDSTNLHNTVPRP